MLSYHTSNKLSWSVADEWEPVLLSGRDLRLDEWIDRGQATVVKQGPHRTVYRVDLGAKSVYLKHYRCRNLRSATRTIVRASQAAREWRKAHAVTKRNVPTFEPVALGEQRAHGLVFDNFLVTKAIEDSCSLDEFVASVLPKLPIHTQQAMRRKAFQALARFCAHAHDQGIYHDDFHTGNILIRPNCNGQSTEVEVYLIDLPDVRISKPLSWRSSRNSLAMLLAGWLDHITAAEAWRFLRTYARSRQHLELPDVRAAGQQIAARSRKARRKVIRSRDRRAWRSNRDFQHQRCGAFNYHFVSDLPPSVARDFAQSAPRLVTRHLDSPHKLSHSTVVVRATLESPDGPITVAVKRCRRVGWLKRCLAVFRTGRALRAWYVGHALRARGVETVEPIVAVEKAGPWRGRDSYLVTRWISASQNLHEFGWYLGQQPANSRNEMGERLADLLGRHIGRMHAWSTSHRDLKACNFAVESPETDCRIVLLDLDGVRFPRFLTRRHRIRDLARFAASVQLQLWITPRMQIRFLRSYAATTGLDSRQIRALVRSVRKKVHRRLRRRQAVGRPLT